MEMIRIEDAGHPMYRRAMELYAGSFPAHERREDASQRRILGEEEYHFALLYDGDTFVGELLYWETASFRYVEHFCILPELRGRRYGERALAELGGEKPVLLEIDPPVDEISRRRKSFYERCGFRASPYPHLHPPYHQTGRGHALVVMSHPAELGWADYEAFARYLRETVMKDAF